MGAKVEWHPGELYPRVGFIVTNHEPEGKADQNPAKVVSHGRYVTFQMAEGAVPRQMFREILLLVARQRAPPAPA
jgi:hypothetical protein